MKRIGLILILMFSLHVGANAAKSDDNYQIVKTFDQKYEVSDGAKLDMTAVFGTVNIVEWDKNEIDFHIELKINNANPKIIQKYEDALKVSFSKVGKTVSCKASFESPVKSDNGNQMRISYFVKVPKDVYMSLTSSYGDIKVGDVKNPIKVSVRFASFSADKLNGETNTLSVQYGNINVDEVNNADIDVKFGGCDIGTINNLTIDSQYSNIEIGEAVRIDLTSRFGKFEVNNIAQLQGTSKYDALIISNLSKSLELTELSFGSLKVNKVALDFSKIIVTAKYSPVKIRLTDQHSYSAKLQTKYGKIRGIGDPDMTDDDNTIYINENVGNSANPRAVINITNSFGDIILNK